MDAVLLSDTDGHNNGAAIRNVSSATEIIYSVILICETSYFQDRHRKENPKPLRICYVFCFVIIFPVLFRYWKTFIYTIRCKQAELSKNKVEQKKWVLLHSICKSSLIQSHSELSIEPMICWSRRIATLRWFDFSNVFWNQRHRKYSRFRLFYRGRIPLIVSKKCYCRTEIVKHQLNLNFFIVREAFQMLSLASSIFSMAWCIASYHRCIRFSQIDKINISWIGSIVQSSWLLSITSEFNHNENHFAQ